MKEIQTIEEIKVLVDAFYTKVREDELLAPIFNGVIQEHWSEHLEKLYRFWQTVLLHEHTYVGSPFVPHAHLPVSKEHFDRSIELFNQTVDSLYTGKIAEEAKWRAGKMAEMFHYKIEHYKRDSSQPIL